MGWGANGRSAFFENIIHDIPDVQVDRDELTLRPMEGKWYYADKPFSGHAVDCHPDGRKSEDVGCYNGRKEGIAQKWYPNGELQKESYYRANHLEGVVRIWSPGPQRALVAESNYVEGTRHGLQRRWFSSGQLQRSTHFNMGMEEGLQQSWLENGKIYVNYEAKNGRTFGLRKATLCYELDDEKIK